MALDLAKLSDADLEALQKGDLSKVSDEGLAHLSGQPPKVKLTAKEALAQGYLSQGKAYTDPNFQTIARTGLTDIPVAIGELTGLASQPYIQQREAEYQAAAKRAGTGAGFGRGMFGAITSAPLALIPGAPAGMGLLGRVGVGAATGAGIGAISQPTSGQGNFLTEKGGQMLGGALVGGALPVVGEGLGLGANWLSDLRDRLSPDMNALRITREALGNDPNQIAAVMAANRAQPNALASEAAAALPTPMNAYQTLLRTGEQLNTAPENASAVRAVQQQTHLDELARLAGGATQTEAEAAAAASRRGLNQVTTPMREEAFAKAAVPGEVFPVLERKAAEGRAAASGAVQDVRRFTAAIQTAEDWARDWTASGTTRAPGALPRPPSRYTYPGELAVKAEQVATGAAEESLQAGAKARAAENTLASMKSRGLEPLTAQPLVSGIETKLANPEIALNAKTAPALRRVSQMAEDWTNQNGYITPEALYAIRKHGVNAAIEDLMPGASESARKAAASRVMTEVRPIIDDMLGDKFKAYLTTFENNARAIDRQGLSAKLMELYQRSPDEFVRVVKGNNPDVVDNLMGGGVRDIKEAMGNQFGRVQKIADDLVRDTAIQRQASEGSPALSGILARNELNAAIPNFLSPKVTLANKVIGGLEGRVNAKTMVALTKAAQSGASMNDLLMLTPPSERSKVLLALRNLPQTTNAMSPYLINRLAPTAPSGVQQQ